ncbi:MAG: hypothetical protein K2H30_03980, partial [Clostridia bacterium]|nr:hypothetical protein [Clostridia bacterium]
VVHGLQICAHVHGGGGGPGTVLGEGVKIYGAPAVDANSKKVLYKGEEVSIANRIKLSSKVTNGQTPMGIEVSVDTAATVIAYYYSGSSNNTRGLELYDSEKTLISGTTQALSDGNIMATAMFEVAANTTYYIGASVAGVNVYYLAVVYGDIGETWTAHEAKAAECGVAGNIAYSDSNYGRYKDASGTFIMSNKVSIAALEHNYSLKPDSIVIPTNDPETNTGKATLTCANGHETDVELPVLSSDQYEQTSGADNQSTYKITLNGVEITFTAATTETKETTYTSVYTPDLSTLVYSGLGVDNAVAGTGGKTYYVKNKDTDADTAVKVSVADSVVTVNGANASFELNNSVASGVIKVTAQVKMGSNNGSWAFLQIYNNAGEELVAIRSNGSKALQYRVQGGADSGTAVAYAVNDVINFEFIIDCDAKTVSITINNTTKNTTSLIADKVSIDGTKAANVSGVKLAVNSGRTVYLNSLDFATQD